jgi:hypothetical protein
MVTAAAVYPVFSLPIVCSIKLQDASMWLPCIVSSVYRSFVALCAMIARVWLHAAGPRVTARLTILVRALFFICMPEINCTPVSKRNQLYWTTRSQCKPAWPWRSSNPYCYTASCSDDVLSSLIAIQLAADVAVDSSGQGLVFHTSSWQDRRRPHVVVVEFSGDFLGIIQESGIRNQEKA